MIQKYFITSSNCRSRVAGLYTSTLFGADIEPQLIAKFKRKSFVVKDIPGNWVFGTDILDKIGEGLLMEALGAGQRG